MGNPFPTLNRMDLPPIPEVPPIPDQQRTPLVDTLLAIIDLQHHHLQHFADDNLRLRNEVAQLQGQTKRPKINPSTLNQPAPPTTSPEGKKRPKPSKTSRKPRLNPEDVRIPFPNRPPGATTHGWEEFLVQDLVLQATATRYLRERIKLPDGTTVLAPLPKGVTPGRHFGPGLISYLLYQHYHNRVTHGLIHQEMTDLGILISAGELSDLLTKGHDALHQEREDVRRAGLQTASCIGVDDTGARHQGHNGVCTVIGNDLFAYFHSSDSKSRINFLEVLRGADGGYAVNAVAQAYWEEQGLSQEARARLASGPGSFADAASWQAHLKVCGLNAVRLVRTATEGALLGQVIEQGVSPGLIVLSDGAPQFDILVHASCWVHAERPLARAVPYNEAHRAALAAVRGQVWELYQDLKAYRAKPDPAAKGALEARFDALVGQKTNYPTTIGAALKEMQAHRADLLRVLERPEVPLHNNATESDIRCYVTVRKISGGTRSELGRRCRDTFATLKKTCRKLGVSFWGFVQDRVRGVGAVVNLGEEIRRRSSGSGGAVPEEAVSAGGG